MTLRSAMQGSLRPGQTLIWPAADGSGGEDLTGAEIVGWISNRATNATRRIAGAITVTHAAAGEFTWEYDAADVAEAGEFAVQFSAVFPAGATPGRSRVLDWTVGASLVDPGGDNSELADGYGLVRMRVRIDNPAAPAEGYALLYLKDDGLYIADDAGGIEGPFQSAGTAIADHVGEEDPHPQYLTADEGAAAFAATGHSHAGYAAADHTHAATGDMLAATYDSNADGTVDAADYAATAGSATSATTATSAGDADTLDGNHAAAFAASTHSHSGYAADSHTHAGYAASGHDHSGTYAAAGHSHNYAATAHNHDSAYSASGHSHAGMGDMLKATYDTDNDGAVEAADYAATAGSATSAGNADTVDGQHAAAFAAAGHDHSGTYSATGHTHDYSGTYAASGHNHSGTYATAGHDHSGTYAPASVTQYTDEQAQDAVAAALAAGTHTNITVTYDDAGNKISLAAASGATYTDEQAQDAAASMITGATHSGLSVSYNDAGGTLAFTVADQGGIAKTLIDAKGDLLVGSGADAAARLAVGTNGQHLEADSAATNGVKWASVVRYLTLGVPGTLTAAAGTVRLYVPFACTIVNVRASVGTAPTGASLIVDVNKNGTSIFTTTANRPTITATNFTDLSSTPDTTAIAADDYLTIDVDQIGSTVAGSDLVVTVVVTVP